MATRTFTLRTILAVITIAVTSIALLVAGTLIVLTTYMGQTSQMLATAVESVHLAAEAELQLLLHERAEDPIVQRRLESDLLTTLTSARKYVTSDKEVHEMAVAEARMQEYLAAAREVPRRPELGKLHEAAYDALEDLVHTNVAQSRDAQEYAARWDHWGNYIGISASGLLLLLAGYLLWWLKARAFRPIIALARAMEWFRLGDRSARAEESGPAELHDIARRFNEMADSLCAQRDAQMAFLGGVAHDLRNPLGALMSSVTMLRPDEALPPEPAIRRLLQVIERQIRHLERMIGDLLDIAKIEAGQLALEFELHDARGLLLAVRDLFQGASLSHQLEVLTPSTPILVACDPLRMEQVVSNLVSNAIKYSPDGGKVQVVIVREAGEATISISDQGIGISEADQERLFEPFQRVGLARETAPGVGLGLFVVRRIVEAHGGRIELESTPGKGSTFRVHLPLGAEVAQDDPDGRPGTGTV
jgi:signal transduction histidine kinase